MIHTESRTDYTCDCCGSASASTALNPTIPNGWFTWTVARPTAVSDNYLLCSRFCERTLKKAGVAGGNHPFVYPQVPYKTWISAARTCAKCGHLERPRNMDTCYWCGSKL